MSAITRRHQRMQFVVSSARNDRRAPIIAALATAIAIASSPALAQSTDPAPGAPRAGAPSTQGYGDDDKTCTAWSDACVSCQIDADGQLNCNNIGIACQPQSVTCSRRGQELPK